MKAMGTNVSSSPVQLFLLTLGLSHTAPPPPWILGKQDAFHPGLGSSLNSQLCAKGCAVCVHRDLLKQ